MVVVLDRLVQQHVGFPREVGAEQQTDDIDQQDARVIDALGQEPDDRLDADVTALRLDRRRRHEDGADDQEHRDFVLPIRRQMQEIAGDDAVGQNEGSDHEGDRGEDHHDVVDERDAALENPGVRGERRGRGLDVVEAVGRHWSKNRQETWIASASLINSADNGVLSA